MSLPAPHCYQVQYQAQPPLLRGTVRCSMSAVEFTESCELLLAVAQEHSCPFWLLDGRADNVGHSNDVYEWMREEFLPRTHRVLGRVPCLAFVAHPEFWQALQARHYVLPSPLTVSASFRTNWFVDEAEALAWLAQFRPAIGVPETQEAPPVTGEAS